MRAATLALAAAFVLGLLSTAGTASGGNIATPLMTQVATWAAMKPVSVWCESDPEAWTAFVAERRGPADASGYADIPGGRAHIAPKWCHILRSQTLRRERYLGVAVMVLLHESWHLRGERDEAITECAARVLLYAALHNFYGVGWFSPQMRSLTETALAVSLSAPAHYQHGCDRLG